MISELGEEDHELERLISTSFTGALGFQSPEQPADATRLSLQSETADRTGMSTSGSPARGGERGYTHGGAGGGAGGGTPHQHLGDLCPTPTKPLEWIHGGSGSADQFGSSNSGSLVSPPAAGETLPFALCVPTAFVTGPPPFALCVPTAFVTGPPPFALCVPTAFVTEPPPSCPVCSHCIRD